MLKRRPLQKLRLAIVLGSVALGFATLGCGGNKDDKIEKSADKKPAAEAGADTNTPPPKIAAPAQPIERTVPPPSVFGGSARVINLAMKDGAPVAVDLWAVPSALYTEVKLVENLAFGEASDWFQSPKGSPIRAFVAGTKPSPKEALTGVAYARKGTHLTGIMLNRADGTIKTSSNWDASENPEELQTPDAPPAGKGYVVLRADQLRLHEKAMAATTGGRPFQVGDGKKSCLRQRIEDMGYQPSLLGGTQPVKLDLDPGKHTISFHKGDAKGCKKAAKVYEVAVDVKEGEAQTVVLFTPDIKTVRHLVLPTPVNTAKPYGANKKLRAAKSAERAARKIKKDAERAEKAAKAAAEAAK